MTNTGATLTDAERALLAKSMHRRNQFDYDQCDHGSYTGGPSHGEPYAMCERAMRPESDVTRAIESIVAARVAQALAEEERRHDRTCEQRDDATDWAEKLAAAIAHLTSCDLGEHSSSDNPWANALEAADNFAPSGAPTSTEDDRARTAIQVFRTAFLAAGGTPDDITGANRAAMVRAAVAVAASGAPDHAGPSPIDDASPDQEDSR